MYIVVILILLTIDVPYFMLALATYFIGIYIKPKLDVKDVSTVYNLCWPCHVDFLLHMNNGKYYREMDYGWYDFVARTRTYEEMRKRNSYFVKKGTLMRYRRALNAFQPFKIETKLVYFDKKAFYIEQRFVSPKDNFIHAIAYSTFTIMGCKDVIKFFRCTH